jgi:hypothetical protein
MANVKKATKKSAAAATRKGRMTAKEYAKKHCSGLGAVEAIVLLGKKGYDQRQIIDAGYNKNTVYRQYREQVQA